MNIALLGGTFNPPHNGHLRVARSVLDRLGYERIVFIPAFIPPLKDSAPIVSPFHRIAMLQRALADFEAAVVDDVEIRRQGVSYTLDTLRFCREHYGCPRPGLIIGDDHVPLFAQWREPDLLASEGALIVVNRSGLDTSSFRWEHRRIDLAPDGISSKAIRQFYHNGDESAARKLVPPAVFDYIRKEGLYRDA